MADENDDVLKANEGAPAVDIPDLKSLKKKEKERKRAGAAWSGARGAASDFTGATGGTVSRAAASAAGSAAEGAGLAAEGAGAAAEGFLAGAEALEGGGMFGALSRFFAGLTSTLLGKLAVAAAALLMVAGVGFLGFALHKGGDAGLGAPDLGAISDSMRVRAGGRDRMGVAGNGEIRFDPLNPSAPKPEPKVEEAKPQADPDAEPKDRAAAEAVKGSLAGQDKLAHNLSGAKLSGALGGQFGGQNIFAGSNGEAPRFNSGMSNITLPRTGGQKGQLGAMQSRIARAPFANRSVANAKSNRAIGQAKWAKGMSMLGAQAGTAEAAADSAQGAFDQSQASGGTSNTAGTGTGTGTGGGTGTGAGTGTGTGAGSGTGAPDTSLPAAPSIPTGTAVDSGLQNALDSIGQMADAAGKLLKKGKMMIAAGLVLIALGMAAMKIPVYGTIIGAILIGLGAMLLGMGYMMMQMADKMAQMAKSAGSQLASQIGNVQQGQVINYCTDQALAGTSTQNCNPPASITNVDAQTTQTQSDVQRVQAIPTDTPTVQ